VDVRIIAATHRNLEAMIREGKFREDLFHRLNVVCLQLPPLCERREDIPVLVQLFFANMPAISASKLRPSLPTPWPCSRPIVAGQRPRVGNVARRLFA